MQNFHDNGNINSLNRSRVRWALGGLIILLIIAGSVLLITKNNNGSSGFPRADQEHSTVYRGMSAFINSGLSTDQVNGLTKAFSKFAPKAKAVSIDTNSLTPGPHDPNIVSPFTIIFNVSIDSARYKGEVSYSDLTSVELTLSGSSGNQVFDSGVVNSQH